MKACRTDNLHVVSVLNAGELHFPCDRQCLFATWAVLILHLSRFKPFADICAVKRTEITQRLSACRAGTALQTTSDLSHLRPQLQREWHPLKNKHLGSSRQNPFSFAKAVWLCPDCRSEWQTRIIDRAYSEASCQQCARRMSCAHSKEPFMLQWSHIANENTGIYPDHVSINSHTKVFWICRKCPQKWAHEWLESPFERAQHPHTCCPQCAGKQACICNDAPRASQ